MKTYSHNELANCDLIIDAIYEGGNSGNAEDDPVSFPKVGPIKIRL